MSAGDERPGAGLVLSDRAAVIPDPPLRACLEQGDDVKLDGEEEAPRSAEVWRRHVHLCGALCVALLLTSALCVWLSRPVAQAVEGQRAWQSVSGEGLPTSTSRSVSTNESGSFGSPAAWSPFLEVYDDGLADAQPGQWWKHWPPHWPHLVIFSRLFWGCGLRWLEAIPVGALAGMLLIPVFFLALALIGFTTGGVMAGSCAACCQAHIGAVVGGSCFAMAQSVGAHGISAGCQPNVMLAMAVVGALGSPLIMYFFHCELFTETCCAASWRWWSESNSTSAIREFGM